MKRSLFFIPIILWWTTTAGAEILIKGAPVCTTKEYFKEYVKNRKSPQVLSGMLIDGKCKCNVMEGMKADVLAWDGFSFTKVKLLWGKEYFIGWTDTNFVK